MKRLLLLALCALLSANADARTLYVDASRPNNNGSGLSRAKAKKTIQAAINVAQAGDTILVYPGKYAPIKANNKKIVIKSVSGAAKTMIVKPKVSAGTIALAQLGKSWKYTYVSTGGSAGEVKGRTYTASSYPISDGKKTTLAGFLLDGLYRGGDYVVGVSGGTVKSCTIQRIGGESDGVPGCAAVYASLTGCKIQSNRYVGSAFGIVSDCTLHRCKITKNRGWWPNFYWGYSPLFVRSTVVNSLVLSNKFNDWGFDQSKLVNCTIAENLLIQDYSEDFQFSYGSKYYNCILRNNRGQYNGAKKIHNVDSGNTYKYTFKKNPDPKFTASYGLATGSPCIDAGTGTEAILSLVGAKDLAGNKRVKGKAIDMGCYER